MKMRRKIGIMTMQRVANYGSFLQAYALKKAIETLGFEDVAYIDYEYEGDVIEHKSKLSSVLKKIIKTTPRDLVMRIMAMRKFRYIYSNDYLRMLGVTTDCNYSKDVDTLVIGSDEVFNCMQSYPVGYSRGLFGMGYEDKKVISYAASFGYTKIEDLKEHEIDKEIGCLLDKFHSISVRDENSKKIINSIARNKEVSVHLDPVLIGDFEEFKKNDVPIKNYIIVYAYQNRLTKKEERYIRLFAKKYNKKVISIGMYQRCADENIIVSPFELLAYFNHADYVITDTFHGTAFSIKMNTKFCTIIRESNKNKLESLLKYTHLSGRTANCLEDIEKCYNEEIDFSKCNNYIASETRRSIKYLKDNL